MSLLLFAFSGCVKTGAPAYEPMARGRWKTRGTVEMYTWVVETDGEGVAETPPRTVPTVSPHRSRSRQHNARTLNHSSDNRATGSFRPSWGSMGTYRPC